jgi:hypothetical protein
MSPASDADDGLASSSTAPSPALLAAARSLLAPLVELAIARGVRYGEFDELIKTVFIDAARRAHAGVPVQRAVSRISASTGINRREVTRLLQEAPSARGKPRSPATEVFARWVTDPAYQQDGVPQRLPRLGAAPSFESLATSVNRDVRPRTLLEELCRLDLARVLDDDTVELRKTNFTPSNDETQMLDFLSANVGDHLRAATENVLSPGIQHLEQALFADELSARSIEHLRPYVNERWKALVRELTPMVQGLIDDDAASDRPQDHRLRIGMYAYTTPMAAADDPNAELGTKPELDQP